MPAAFDGVKAYFKNLTLRLSYMYMENICQNAELALLHSNAIPVISIILVGKIWKMIP